MTNGGDFVILREEKRTAPRKRDPKHRRTHLGRREPILQDVPRPIRLCCGLVTAILPRFKTGSARVRPGDL